MLGLAYFHFVPVASKWLWCMYRVRRQHLWSQLSLSTLRRIPEIEPRVKLAWQVSLSTEPSYCPLKCFCVYFFTDTSVWVMSSLLKVEILKSITILFFKICQLIYVDAVILDGFQLDSVFYHSPFFFCWFLT